LTYSADTKKENHLDNIFVPRLVIGISTTTLIKFTT